MFIGVTVGWWVWAMLPSLGLFLPGHRFAVTGWIFQSSGITSLTPSVLRTRKGRGCWWFPFQHVHFYSILCQYDTLNPSCAQWQEQRSSLCIKEETWRDPFLVICYLLVIIDFRQFFQGTCSHQSWSIPGLQSTNSRISLLINSVFSHLQSYLPLVAF